MTNIINPHKEYLAGLTGMGGGPAGLALRGATAAQTYIEDVFNIYNYTGNCASNGNGTTQTITTGLDMANNKGMVWFKDRESGTAPGKIFNTIRGNGKSISPSSTDGDSNDSGLDSFGSDGLVLGDNSTTNLENTRFCAWNFRAAPGFFDVVSWVGTDTAAIRTIPHSLGCKPGFIIARCVTDDSREWLVYHKSLAAGGQDAWDSYLRLNDDHQESTIANWGNTEPSDENFYIRGQTGDYALNVNGHTHIAYLFADGDETNAQIFGKGEDEEIIKMGTYTGDGNNNVLSIDLGWEPQWVLLKKKESGGTQRNWVMYDNQRGVFSPDINTGVSQSTGPMRTGADTQLSGVAFYQDGFKLKSNELGNEAGYKYIYVAIRRPDSKVGRSKVPVKTDLFNVTLGNGSTIGPAFTADFSPDMLLHQQFNIYSGGETPRFLNRLVHGGMIMPWHSSTSMNETGSAGMMAYAKGAGYGSTWNSNTIGYMWRRFPGFFDTVWYKGTGSTQTIKHDLTTVPKMIWFVNIKTGRYKPAYINVGQSSTPTNFYYRLDSDNVTNDNTGTLWNSTAPTSSVFTVNTSNLTNDSGDHYLAVLFGDLAGRQKFGMYTGTGDGGGDTAINCGFQPRVVVCRVIEDGYTSNWCWFDTARDSFNSSDRKYLTMDTSYGEIEPDDLLVALDSSGFTIKDEQTTINQNGVDYMWWAIA